MGLAVPSGFAGQGLQRVTLHIEGMTCGACVKDVKAALVPGVSTVEITVGKKWGFLSDYADARALVTYDPDKAKWRRWSKPWKQQVALCQHTRRECSKRGERKA